MVLAFAEFSIVPSSCATKLVAVALGVNVTMLVGVVVVNVAKTLSTLAPETLVHTLPIAKMFVGIAVACIPNALGTAAVACE